jgi:predicted DNA-binding protein
MMLSNDHIDEMPKVTVTAFIEEELKEGLKALSDAERRSMSQMVAVLIERAVNEAVKKGQIPAPSTNSTQ